MSNFKAIAAMSKNRVIGDSKSKKLPWHLPEDFKFFREKTLNQHLIMGRKTFENVGVLSKRVIWVVTRTNNYGWNQLFHKDGSMAVNIVTDISALPTNFDYWVAGGSEIYSLFLPKITEFYVTEIEKEYEGDTLMPEFEKFFQKKDLVLENADFKIFKYD